jgi:hypothetical protein
MKGAGAIIISAQPRGVFHEGYVVGTPKPGTLMQIVAGTAMDDTGRFNWEPFNADADGDQRLVAVLLDDILQGKLYSDAYATGDRVRLYCPLPGEELNVLKGDVAGTGDDFTVGQLLIINDGDGKVIATTGTPESEPFICLEAITDPTADQLVWVMCTGR